MWGSNIYNTSTNLSQGHSKKDEKTFIKLLLCPKTIETLIIVLQYIGEIWDSSSWGCEACNGQKSLTYSQESPLWPSLLKKIFYIFENFNFFNPSWWRQHYKRGNWWVQKSLGSKITNINTKTYSPTKTTDPTLNFMELVWNYMKCKKKCTLVYPKELVLFLK